MGSRDIFGNPIDHIPPHVLAPESDLTADIYAALSREYERELVDRMRRGDVAAKDELARRNFRGARMIAKKAWLSAEEEVEYEEIASVCLRALVLALRDYSPARSNGRRFFAYAAQRMQGELQQAFRLWRRPFKLPRHIDQEAKKLIDAIEFLREDLELDEGERPPIEVIADYLNKPEDEVDFLLALVVSAQDYAVACFDTPAAEDEDGETVGVGEVITGDSDHRAPGARVRIETGPGCTCHGCRARRAELRRETERLAATNLYAQKLQRNIERLKEEEAEHERTDRRRRRRSYPKKRRPA
jgi:DNA-directed RNA polymerase specialized sigma subunit